MGMKTHSLLVMILNGQRKIGLKQLPYLAKGLRLSPQDQLYLQGMVQLENAGSIEEKQMHERWLSQHAPVTHIDTREIDQFWMISDWIHMAILEILTLKNFDGSISTIQKKLRIQFSTQEISSAVRRLRSFRLLEERDGKLVRTAGMVQTKNDVPNAGVREYHKQVAELAKKAIEEQTSEEREFQSFAIACAKSKMPIAKKMIREFRAELCKVLSSEPGDEVYHMNMHFFQLTQEEKVKIKKKGKATHE
jgi:uncharacterized protein (TIGR02147 family)